MRRSSQGISLIETLIAVVIALLVMVSLGGVVIRGTVQNKNQGVETTRVTVYAQDKIETLATLDWSSCTQSTPAAGCNTTGFTATAWNKGLKDNSSPSGALTQQTACPTSGPAVGYMDYLDANGNQITGTDCTTVGIYAYQRQWQVTDLITTAANTPGLKRIDVRVWSRNVVNIGSRAPDILLTTYITE